MQFLVLLLVVAFVSGGTTLGRRILGRRLVLLGLSFVAAVCFYSVRVVM